MASKIRARVAQLLWLVCALAALLLAVGALLIALDANQNNDLVDVVLRGADYVDLGVFSREPGSSSSAARTPASRTPSSTGASGRSPGWWSDASSTAS